MPAFTLRKYADKSGPHFDATTGKPLERTEPWPLLGIRVGRANPKNPAIFDATPLETAGITMSSAEKWLAEGLCTLENRRVVHAPGGPKEQPWRKTHTFTACDAIVFDTLDGKVRYVVTRNPGKYYDADDVAVQDAMDRYGEPSHVHWDFKIELAA